MNRRIIIGLIVVLAATSVGVLYLLTTKMSLNFQSSVKFERSATERRIKEQAETSQLPEQKDSHKDLASSFKEKALKSQNADDQQTFWMSAISEWKSVLEMDPDDKIVLNELGYSYFYLMNLSRTKEDAISHFHAGVEYFNRVLSTDPTFHWSLFGLGMLYFDIAERTNTPVEYLDKAIAYFDSGFEYDANYIWGHLSKAWAYFKIGNITNDLVMYRKAIPEFNKVLQIDPSNQSAKDGVRFSEEKL